MKNIFFFILFFFFLNTYIFAQTEYASVSPISAQSSYNDFADIHVTVTAGAGYYWFFSAVQFIDWQSGSSWINIVQDVYDDDWPYDGQWHTWSISSESIQITGIAYKGNGTYKYKFAVDVNDDDEDEFVSFTVTDITAPAAPQNLSVSANQDDYPVLTWVANSEVDIKEYDIWRYSTAYEPTWLKIATTSNNSWTDTEVSGYDPAERILYKIKAIDYNSNSSSYSDEAVFYGYHLEKGRGLIASDVAISSEYQLLNYPNPFNPTTKISYSLPEESHIKLCVFSISGELIETLVDSYRYSGDYTVDFNGSNLPTGIYFINLETKNRNFVKRMLLVK